MPARESELLAVVADAQKQYAADHSASSAKDARVALQVRVIAFMKKSPAADDWVGTVRTEGITPAGNRWITIDLGHGATISTWQNEQLDRTARTLLKDHSALFAVTKVAKLGQRIVFSGAMLSAVLASDDDMVARPQFIARFSALKLPQ